MTLTSGTSLGPYQIESFIGAGAMGEVYRARDPRLARNVAIKIIPDSLVGDPEHLRRFEQEARLTGALNHPNILAVYDIGVHGQSRYIVSELLEGETLRQALSIGALSPKRATDYAAQIALGLGGAHEKGIVHRDLKPENVFVTTAGTLKILDFGLAKQQRGLSQSTDDGATLGSTLQTSAGVVLGTVGYMAPEQVRGEPADHRSDIFALGAVLYEMLSGQRAFKRGSTVETMSAILKDDPPEIIRPEEPHISPALERIMRRCIEKNSSKRFQSAKDLCFALENLTSITSRQDGLQAIPIARNNWRYLTAILSVLALASLALAIRGFLAHPLQPEYRQLTYRRGDISGARFSPDGQTVIYSAAWDRPGAKLYSSRLDGNDLRELQLPGGDILSVSRYGELVISLNDPKDRLARASLDGGAPRELLDDVASADWSPDGKQLAVSHYVSGKWRLEFPIGKVLYETIGSLSDVRFSPQGDAIAFMEHPNSGDDRGTVGLTDLSGNKRVLTPEWAGEQGLAWSPDGSEVWFTAIQARERGRPLFAVNRSGKQRLVLNTPGELVLSDIARDGRVLMMQRQRRFEVMLGELGGETHALSWLEIMLGSALSRDGKYALLGDWSDYNGSDYGVYLAKLDGSPAVLLGNGASGDISPDNRWVTSILPSDDTKVLLLPTSVGETKTVTAPHFHYLRANWASDGRRLIVQASDSGRLRRWWVQDLTGGAPRAITPEGTGETSLCLNHSDYVAGFDAVGAHLLYPVDGGEPRAPAGITNNDSVFGGSPNANFLYVTPDASSARLEVLKVDVSTGARRPFVTISPTDPAGLNGIFEPRFTPDEKRFIYTQDRVLSVLYVASAVK